MEGFHKSEIGEMTVDEGRGILVKKKDLYHGSSVSGISLLQRAENDTVGAGAYLTSVYKDAQGYAERRAKNRQGEAVVYRAQIENMRFADLRTEANVHFFLKGFGTVLREKLSDDTLHWTQEAVMDEALEKIASGSINHNNLKHALHSTGKYFSDYLASLGYDGLIALEGGEGDEIQNHDTYLVFDPSTITSLAPAIE